jgi:branched-chain amino acid transport system substrate-binding protein
MTSTQRQLRRARRIAPTLVAVAGAALALALSGCSSSSTSAASGTAAGSSGSSGSASGSPYKVMFIEDITGDVAPGQGQLTEDALKTDDNALNARGGIHGHPIDLIVCDSASNNNGDAACGQEAVSDQVLAVVASGNEAADLQYLAAAKIPSLNNGYQPQEWTNPDSFSIDTAGLAGILGPPAVVKFAGCSTYAFVEADFPAAFQQATITGEKQGQIDFGARAVATIFPTASTVDMSPYILQAAHSGAQCIVIAGDPAQEVGALQASLTLPKSVKVLAYQSNLSEPGEPASLQSVVGQLGDRLILIGSTAPATSKDPLVQQWAKDQGGTDLESTSAINWASLRLIDQGANAIYPNVNAAGLQNYLNHLSSYNPGISGVVGFDKSIPNPYGSRVFAAYVLPQKMVNGTFPAIGPFINLITAGKSS